MILHKDHGLTIYFGDSKSCAVPPTSDGFLSHCADLAQQYNLNHLVFDKQVHGVVGRFIDGGVHKQQLPILLFTTEGDFLYTTTPHFGIGVLTADCLPIVFYVPQKKLIAVAHAGWRGSVAGIVTKTIESMLGKNYFSPNDLIAYFGPSAKSCCYEVQKDFIDQNKGARKVEQALVSRNNKMYLDVPAINRVELIDLGVPPSNIITTYNHCTICNSNFHSYRRQGKDSLRQLTIAWLAKL